MAGEWWNGLYHIAICDDDKLFVEYIKKIIIQVEGDTAHTLKFYEFYSGEELLLHIEDNIQYDLLILDMFLGGMDGNETAIHFRQRHPYTTLVFCSGVCQPTAQSFKVSPFRYLLKSDPETLFLNEVSEILKEVKRNARELFLVGHYRNGTVRVRLKNILYIENAKRGSRAVVSADCKEAEFEGRILLDEKLKVLSERYEELVFAHNSYVVNIDHVENVNNHELLLDNGEKLSVSRTYQKSFRLAFTKNLAKKYM